MRHFARLVLVTLSVATFSQAGLIFVSGDSNIGNGIDGSLGIPLEDNGHFFANVLGSGRTVLLQRGGPITPDTEMAILNLYNSLPSVTATAISTAPPGNFLAGVDLFLTGRDLVGFSDEIDAIGTFLNAGGTAFFLGDNLGRIHEDFAINVALASLGSSIRIIPASLDNGVHIANGSHILSSPFTAGVGNLSYASTSAVSGGTALFTTSDGTPFVEFATAVPEPKNRMTVLLLGIALFAIRKSLHT